MQITGTSPDGTRKLTLEVELTDTIADVKKKVQDRDGIPVLQQRFLLGEKPLLDTTTLDEIGDEIESSGDAPNAPTFIQLVKLSEDNVEIVFIERNHDDRRTSIQVELSDTVLDIKTLFMLITGTPIDDILFICNGKKTKNITTVNELKFDDPIVMNVFLVGTVTEGNDDNIECDNGEETEPPEQPEQPQSGSQASDLIPNANPRIAQTTNAQIVYNINFFPITYMPTTNVAESLAKGLAQIKNPRRCSIM